MVSANDRMARQVMKVGVNSGSILDNAPFDLFLNDTIVVLQKCWVLSQTFQQVAQSPPAQRVIVG